MTVIGICKVCPGPNGSWCVIREASHNNKLCSCLSAAAAAIAAAADEDERVNVTTAVGVGELEMLLLRRRVDVKDWLLMGVLNGEGSIANASSPSVNAILDALREESTGVCCGCCVIVAGFWVLCSSSSS